MDPAFPSGCTIAAAQSWDGDSSLEGEIVAFDSEHIDTGVGDSGLVETEPWIAHRVVAEYESYDMDEANHYGRSDGHFVVEDDAEEKTRIIGSSQGYADAKALEGDRVLVLQGDNNEEIDRALVHEDEVLGVLSEESPVALQDLETWPCAAVDAAKAAHSSRWVNSLDRSDRWIALVDR